MVYSTGHSGVTSVQYRVDMAEDGAGTGPRLRRCCRQTKGRNLFSYLGRVQCLVLKMVSLEGGMQGRGPVCNDGRIRVGIIIATDMVESQASSKEEESGFDISLALPSHLIG